MFKLDPIEKNEFRRKIKIYEYAIKSQLDSEKDSLANISNATGIIMACVDRLNWAGFYILREKQLVLGPFQGLPACNRIDIGKGVCGAAAKTKEVQLVPDVHQFPGHIACDSLSNSELVIPIIKMIEYMGIRFR